MYKQATKGDCDAKARPTRLDIKGYAKFTEWMKHKGMTKLDACSMYVSFRESIGRFGGVAESKDRSGRNAEKRKSGGTFGRSQSTMSRLEGEDGEEEEITSLLKAAKEGDFDKLLKCLRAGADAESTGRERRTP